MTLSVNASECLARAAQERELAAKATLEKIREQHLRSAQTWEELGRQILITTDPETKNE